MKITSLLDITGGFLLNSPAISFITQIHTKLSHVNEGDLFISNDIDEIYTAVDKGAFCIISDIDVIISDPEIAWIKVDDLNQTAIKIIRFLLANETINCFYTDEINYELLELYNPDKSKYIFLNNGIDTVESLSNIHSDCIIISKNQKFLCDIYPNSQELATNKYKVINQTIHSLFEVTFSFENKLYTKLRLCSAYINNFLTIREFYNLEDIDENKIKYFDTMNPIFLNKSLQIVDFGKSSRFILTSNSKSKTKIEKKFINSFYSYAKAEFINVKNYSEQDIYTTIKETEANCLYLENIDEDTIKTILHNYSPQIESLL